MVKEKIISPEVFDQLKARVRCDNQPWKALEFEFPRHFADILINTLRGYLELKGDLSLEEFVDYIRI